MQQLIYDEPVRWTSYLLVKKNFFTDNNNYLHHNKYINAWGYFACKHPLWTLRPSLPRTVDKIWNHMTSYFFSITGSGNSLLPNWHQAITIANDVFAQHHWDPQIIMLSSIVICQKSKLTLKFSDQVRLPSSTGKYQLLLTKGQVQVNTNYLMFCIKYQLVNYQVHEVHLLYLTQTLGPDQHFTWNCFLVTGECHRTQISMA